MQGKERHYKSKLGHKQGVRSTGQVIIQNISEEHEWLSCGTNCTNQMSKWDADGKPVIPCPFRSINRLWWHQGHMALHQKIRCFREVKSTAGEGVSIHALIFVNDIRRAKEKKMSQLLFHRTFNHGGWTSEKLGVGQAFTSLDSFDFFFFLKCENLSSLWILLPILHKGGPTAQAWIWVHLHNALGCLGTIQI